MYMKILTFESENHDQPERTYIFNDVTEVEFTQMSAFQSAGDWVRFAQNCDYIFVSPGTMTRCDEEVSGYPVGRTGYLNVRCGTNHITIVFDRVAFLCNDAGKAVERFTTV